jgi:hypothetical protein
VGGKMKEAVPGLGLCIGVGLSRSN